jgi:dUTP pyrophosphatase
MLIKIRKIRESAKFPEYKTAHSAGADLFACLNEEVVIAPGEIKVIPTGLVFEIESGYEVQVRPRSGLAAQGISVPNAPGTIDSDYRGEVGVILINLGKQDFVVKNGFRMAQIVAAKVEHAEFAEASELSDTARGAGGFGSTGL